ncbi:MAG: beta-glucosidase [Proteobacteria bacterium]|nr:MAG: beta-glucosidase [Pseudomonadota bacterium]
MAKRLLPDHFRFGASSAAFAIEGGLEETGRSPSIWDKFCTRPGAIIDQSNADYAADHFRQWESDTLLMKKAGLQIYNFSMSWSRVLPNGTGSLNDAGIDFYDRLVDGILEQGIDPFLTLNHWDLPLVMEDRGGWVKRDVIYHFSDYAQKIAAKLGDRVKNWITHHDPHAQSYHGYATGLHAPGEEKPRAAWIAAHHLLLSHHFAADAIRSERAGMQVGIALNVSPIVPASESDADHREAMRIDGRENRWYLDPLLKGEYPDDIFRLAKADSGEQGIDWIERGDLEKIKGSSDFIGVNYYSRTIARTSEKIKMKPSEYINKKDITDTGTEVAPDMLRELLLDLNKQYELPAIYITENGAAYDDAPNEFGRIQDGRRALFMSRHLEAIREAIEKGVKVEGYFARSFFDSFEWNLGYTKRYGMVWVDFETQERTLKDSAYWYKRLTDTRDHDWVPNVDYRE